MAQERTQNELWPRVLHASGGILQFRVVSDPGHDLSWVLLLPDAHGAGWTRFPPNSGIRRDGLLLFQRDQAEAGVLIGRQGRSLLHTPLVDRDPCSLA